MSDEKSDALKVADARFKRMVDSDIVGVVVAGASGEVIEANDYYLRLIGFSRADLEGGQIDWRAITPPEWHAADEKALGELRQRGTCTPYEKEYLRRDGARVAVVLANTMLPGPGEQIAAFVLDLTERKRVVDALRASEEQFRTLFENNSAAIAIIEADTTISLVNEA